MRRQIARRMNLWMKLFVLSLLVARFVDLPAWLELAVPIGLVALSFVRPPASGREPVEVQAPVRGRWAALNSPGSKVPSHGVKAYGQAHAIDVLHPRPPGSRKGVRWLGGMRAPEGFSSFGEPVLAVADGVVVHVDDRQRDHRSRESWPALAYMLTIEGAARELGGPRFVLGNHVVVDHGDSTYAAYAHLRRGSARVRPGEVVAAGQQLAEVGNSGNTTEPHLHIQLMDRPVVTEAAGVPFRWTDIDITDDTDPTYVRGAVSTEVEPGLPRNGQVFAAR